jgi:hypothetical protein
MNISKDQSERGKLVVVVYGFGILLTVYFFSMGPVCRWLPAFARTIYAPIAPLVYSETFRPVFRAWLLVWGIDIE